MAASKPRAAEPEDGKLQPRFARLGHARIALVCAVVALVAGAAAYLLSTYRGSLPPLARTSQTVRPPPPPILLDELAPARRRASPEPRVRGNVPAVIGVGTGEFSSQPVDDSAVVRVDGDSASEAPPSDAEVRRQLAALEREQEKVEEALRNGYAPASGTGDLIWPARGPITSPFGPRWGRLHAGLDIGMPIGTPVRAADAGRIIISAPMGAYGNYVCAQHTRTLSTCYAHLSRFAASKGEQVRQGEVIAYSGNTGASTGPHLHFETRVNGKPVDPKGYL